MIAQLTRAADAVAAALAVLAKASLVLIVVSVTADAIGRYLFNAPIPGTQAIVEGLLQPAVVFLAAALTGRRDAHMKVEFFPFHHWPALALARDAAWAGLAAMFWAICAWQAGSRAYGAWLAGQWPVGEIDVPVVVSYGVTCIGCTAAAFAHAVPLSASGQKEAGHGH